MTRYITIGLALIVAFATSAQAQTVLYVDVNADLGPHDGHSWCYAYLTLHEALAVAGPDTVIRVANGTYLPDPTGLIDPREATFQLANGVTIEGGYTGCGAVDPDERDTALYETVLSGDLNGDDDTGGDNSENCYHVVTGSGTDLTAVLDGFTITGGHADGSGEQRNGGGMYNDTGDPTLSLCTFSGNSAEGYNARGGGMYSFSGNPTLTTCVFTGNSSSYTSGGMHNEDGSPELTGCTFTANRADSAGGGMYNDSWHDLVPGNHVTLTDCTFSGNQSGWAGGGMYNTYCNSTLTDCTFENNRTDGSTNGGGGILNDRSSLTLTGCTFRGNSATIGGGGGLYNMADSNAIVLGCTFSGNSAYYYGGGMYNRGSATVINCSFSGNSNDTYTHSAGGGMSNRGLSSTVVNCVFTENSAGFGGGMHNRDSGSVIVVNCTFRGNSAGFDGGGMYNRNCNPVVSNSILWGNYGGSLYNYGSESPTVTYSCIGGGYTGEGNVSDDPLFTESGVSLATGSPCIDAGNNDALPPDTTDLDDDGDTTEPIPYDRAFNIRRMDDPAVDPDPGNPGNPGPPVVDMGAYEVGATLFVDDDATLGGDGSSWAMAYRYLQDALHAAAGPANGISEIHVAQGTYHPDKDEGGIVASGDRQATFQMQNALAIRGGFRGPTGGGDPNERDITTFETILKGDLAGDDIPDLPAGLACFSGDGNPYEPGCESFDTDTDGDVDALDLGIDENSYHVVTGSGTDATAVLDGFTITAGKDDRWYPDGKGAGVYNDGGSPTLTDCTFSGNRARDGGGMYNDGDPTLTGCTFSGNSASSGGGMYNDGDPTLTGCAFTGNSANSAAPHKGGGAIHSYYGRPTLIGCTFSANTSNGDGGAIHNFTPPPPWWSPPLPFTLRDCTFSGNSAAGGGGGIRASTYGGIATLTNCAFSGNSATEGGGMYLMPLSPITMALTNCTFSGNSVTGDGGGIAYVDKIPDSGGQLTLSNCILWGNSDSGGSDESAQIHIVAPAITTLGYSCVEGCSTYCSDPADHNIGDLPEHDPLLVDADGADDIVGTDDDSLRLSPGSPCIDAGDNDADTDASTPEIDRLPETDLGGYPRFVDDPETVDTGNPGSVGPPVVDMGPYEYFVDCNANGIPDAQDIADCTGDPACSDCNLNDAPDECDIADGTADDCDGDGVLDECETFGPGDFDADGNVDLFDFSALQRCFTGVGPAGVPPCCAVFDFEPPDDDIDLDDWAAFHAIFAGP